MLSLLNNSTIEFRRNKSFSAQLENEVPIIAPRKHLHFNSSNYRERVSFIINEILIADLSLFPFRTILANENVSNYV